MDVNQQESAFHGTLVIYQRYITPSGDMQEWRRGMVKWFNVIKISHDESDGYTYNTTFKIFGAALYVKMISFKEQKYFL